MADNNGFSLFGFEVKKKKSEEKIEKQSITSPIEPEADGVVITTGGYGSYAEAFSIGGLSSFKSENELIYRYRKAVLSPEVDSAVEEILNEAIIVEDNKNAVDIAFSDNTKISENLKNKIKEEFRHIYSIMNFQERGYDFFRSWYVDGRLALYKNIPSGQENKGILSIQFVDPLKVKKIKNIKKEKEINGVPLVTDIEIYYEYSNLGFHDNNLPMSSGNQSVVKLTEDSITYITSGLLDETKRYTLSHVHKALKSINMLNMMEDAIVIYRISRAPERRIFYIDVGNLPRQKAEQYVKDIMNRYRNKLVYNPTTGEIDDKRKYQTMLEDYFLPRREGGKGTQVETLPGGQAMNQIEDLEYFLQKVYKSLNVPFSRFSGENSAFFSQASQITRDELKFGRFIERLRTRFSHVFYDLLKTQLILKNIVSHTEWDEIKDDIFFNYAKDNYFAEGKENEILQGRLNMLRDVENHMGKFFSNEWVQKHVLMRDDDSIKEERKKIEQEIKDGILPDPSEEESGRRF
jgi:hypothetical protein